MVERIGAVVLAAGEGRRFGRPKALAELRGTPFVVRVAEAALEVADDVVVVVGADAEAARRLVPSPARAVENADWPKGRTGSLKKGLLALAPVDAFLVWPVDVPVALADDARALVDAFAETRRAAVPVVEGHRGHPVLLPDALRARVLALGDDQPLRDVVRDQDAVEVPASPGTVLDVDTPADLARAEALLRGLVEAVE